MMMRLSTVTIILVKSLLTILLLLSVLRKFVTPSLCLLTFQRHQ